MRLAKHIFQGLMVLFLVATGAAASEGFAQQVLAETNLARTKPQAYAEHLKKFRRQFEGKAYRVSVSSPMVVTNEGVAAVDEAIRYLSKQKALPPLKWSKGLAEAAGDLVRDQGVSGEVGHNGAGSGDMQQRIERHGTWSRTIGENIGYGPDTARLMVMQLIIDDGVSGRGHRKNIFGTSFGVAGVACGAHPRYRYMCVMDFAGGFKDSKEKKDSKDTR